MKSKKEHLANFHLAGATYYDLVLCFQELKIGSIVEARLEPENKFDNRAIALYYEDKKLGFIPKSENRIFYKLLHLNYAIFECRIQQIDPTQHPEHQIKIVAHLIENTTP
ncbi:HIRAN domain-containing protein [Flavobacterium succinicans]|uniref:HIRAN domain protein n=1 Tax=Flavobacterium succinicans TaxID=29536 RepID=A0A199XS49_9FLAO|nr:HIRAN domain-containing protein [Flavobacterium succinicans]OAZ04242.1 HIRAN domain protein [Flavobacterium succinicans]